MTLTETIVGKMHTFTLKASCIHMEVSATLHGIEQHRRTIITGLLWYLLSRRLEGLMNHAHANRERIRQNAMEIGDALSAYVLFTPWEMNSDEQNASIARTVEKYLPTLEQPVLDWPGEEVRVKWQTEYTALSQLAELLKSRIARPYDAEHGLEGILTTQLEAAA